MVQSLSTGSFDYSLLNPDDVTLAVDDARAITESADVIRENMLSIGQRFARQRDRIRGHFKLWVSQATPISPAHAYRFIDLWENCREYDLSGVQISTTGLMELARKSVPSTVREELIERGRDEKLTVADINTALGKAQERRTHEVLTLLTTAPPIVAHIVGKYEVDNPDTIRRMIGAARTNGAWLQEVLTSGYIQPGEEGEAVHINAGSLLVESAIRQRAAAHRTSALDAHTSDVVHLRGRLAISRDGVFHINPSQTTAFSPSISGRRVIITMRVLDD